jgi:hypothetical protein
MSMRCRIGLASFVLAAFVIMTGLPATEPALIVSPARVELTGNFERAQLLVSKARSSDDLTARATYQSSDPSVVSVSTAGELQARAS